MVNDGFYGYGEVRKDAEPSEAARGLELEYLPFGMGGEPGPTAVREAEKARIYALLQRESKKPWWRRKMSSKERQALVAAYNAKQTG